MNHRNGIIHDKEELARVIMEAAIRKVTTLGFTMKLSNGRHDGHTAKPFLMPENIIFYHPDKK